MSITKNPGVKPIQLKLEEDKEHIYGVFGLTEWEVLLPAGKSAVRVSFTGGSMTGHGVVPATFATRNPLMKYLIEQSPQFRSGKIERLK